MAIEYTVSDLSIGTGSENFMPPRLDRKSTRLNSSHSQISYAVFCLKKKNERLHAHVVYIHLRHSGGLLRPTRLTRRPLLIDYLRRATHVDVVTRLSHSRDVTSHIGS